MQANSLPLSLSNRLTFGQPDADGARWTQLFPYGKFKKTVGKKTYVQVLNRAAAERLHNTYQAAGRPELLVDRDHLSNNEEHSTEAFGWMIDSEPRADGLYVLIRPTDIGETAIANRRFKYISGVWDGEVTGEEGGEHIYTPTELIEAGFTNKPNIPVKPLFNRKSTTSATMDNALLTKLIARLGLKSDATEADVMAALPKPKDTSKLENRITELETENETLKKERDALQKTADDAVLDGFDKVITNDNREFYRENLLRNRESTIKILEDLSAAAPEKPGGKVPLSNRKPGKNPEREATPAEDAEQVKESKRAQRIHNRASEISSKENISWSRAWNRAESEIGDE